MCTCFNILFLCVWIGGGDEIFEGERLDELITQTRVYTAGSIAVECVYVCINSYA